MIIRSCCWTFFFLEKKINFHASTTMWQLLENLFSMLSPQVFYSVFIISQKWQNHYILIILLRIISSYLRCAINDGMVAVFENASKVTIPVCSLFFVSLRSWGFCSCCDHLSKKLL
ncbi:hypothetical protein O6H91_15G047100 [Diphasiastrum complanatum]|uniref:Uncharacterized protein n=1 Tax=Diphasiastrum complanatum TaxID=34168 RepID=A0ACC2BI47_DIPCM|nr:hypothetical protein O6H91_15G047100 [Diphasiastrum complanatum]